MKLGTHVAGGLVIAGGIAALAAGGVLLLGAAAATAIKIGMTVFLAGSLYVGEQALSDIRSGRVSHLDQYTRKAVAFGSVVGFTNRCKRSFSDWCKSWRVLALGFGEGLVGSIVTQKLLNEDGEIDWGVAIANRIFRGYGWACMEREKGCKRSWRGKIDSYDEFSKLASDIGKRTDLTDSQKITELQNLFETSSYKVDINIPSDIQYVKGFDAKGNVLYDWPPKLGFDTKTIKSISRTDGFT